MRMVRDVMTRTVWTIESTASVRDAARMMAEKNVGFLPVIHERISCGVITDRDIAVRVVAAGVDPDRTPVGSITSSETSDQSETAKSGIATLAADTPVDDAVQYMDEHLIRRATVHDQDHRIIGVVSRSDLPPEAILEASG